MCLAAFPPERPDHARMPALLAGRGYALRWLRDDDLPWLRDLYASTRAEEMARVPWPDALKRQFLDQQFALQHQHYLAHYADADFLAIVRDGQPVGRYYLRRAAPDHLIVDICLFPVQRRGGVGSALVRHGQAEAAARGHGMRLHVLAGNTAACRLYERLGFASDGDAADGSHRAMRWSAGVTTS